ncbi:sugar kinase [Flavobacterium hydatis]|uniref:Carbohydrate kinase n=1 Tax=Flavobacterium hydatis TaxID=991 RepID=A0A086A7A3_FLAHY|nr:sugar kinase [Flavobacterium hydatis]KFF12567.1 carbohydrate kinase [Flavobacterium hydatis]OXA86798.1 carbohydrate kinase [Flavobacterium hydatis]
MGKVLCFGEILLRYSMGENFPQQQDMSAYIGGAESNVALALARWKVPVAYCTALPDHFLSDTILAYYNKMGVDTNTVIKSGERIGTYYLNQGADVKNAGVIYDRKYSSFSELQPSSINWEEVFEGVSWFHFTAISPALNANIAALCEEALIVATKKRIAISLDLNYREKLWKYGSEPHEVMPKLARYAHVIMGNIWSAEKMLGISINQELIASDKEIDFVEQVNATSREILAKYPNCNVVANTFRFSKNDSVTYFGTLYQKGNGYKSETLLATNTIDKVGTGDCFMAGLIYGILHRKEPQQIIDFAARAAYKKLFIKGDATTSRVEEIEQLIKQNE